MKDTVKTITQCLINSGLYKNNLISVDVIKHDNKILIKMLSKVNDGDLSLQITEILTENITEIYKNSKQS